MKKKKAMALKSKRKATKKKERSSPDAPGTRTFAEGRLPAFDSLLNKYNQKTPIGSNSTSPAADEEME